MTQDRHGRRRTAAPHSLPGLGVVGCGRVWEAAHAPALARSRAWRLAAAWDPEPQRREEVLRRHPGTQWAESLEALLMRRDVEAVLVCAPPAAQPGIVERALMRGKHVLVEKPLGTGARQMEALQARARESGRLVWIGYTRRFREPYRRLRRLIPGAPARAGGVLRFELAVDPGRWGARTPYLGQASQGGDVLADLASHQVDLLGWLLGWGVRSVRAEPAGAGGVRIGLEWSDGPTAECRAIHGKRYVERLVWRMPAQGVVICHGGGCRRLPGGWGPGYRAWARAATFAHLALCRLTGRPNHTQHSFTNQLSAFARAVAGGGSAASAAGLEDALAVWRILEAARRSLAAGGSPETITTTE